ncbi:hypothetical protein BC938DRAFT_479392 [Jimgerdemannia flammicorona]|uniref:Extracellular membrane protein CFEM domain-containing protein n=1 Tax=Jimgerdemannia flammicorona TaxID=994334 RepID=A0A433QKW6_9FUNG|nr:hypothetical protein BC938DRAFT_479392 [Jimgerdemannia flammicorona]
MLVRTLLITLALALSTLAAPVENDHDHDHDHINPNLPCDFQHLPCLTIRPEFFASCGKVLLVPLCKTAETGKCDRICNQDQAIAQCNKQYHECCSQKVLMEETGSCLIGAPGWACPRIGWCSY